MKCRSTRARYIRANEQPSNQRKGQVIGANDMLIAAHALALGRTLVTDNLGEFKRVRGLSTKNWLR